VRTTMGRWGLMNHLMKGRVRHESVPQGRAHSGGPGAEEDATRPCFALLWSCLLWSCLSGSYAPGRMRAYLHAAIVNSSCAACARVVWAPGLAVLGAHWQALRAIPSFVINAVSSLWGR
jgi:hypothetical protein